MKRHASLHPLSEHHHHALVRALEIRRAQAKPPAERERELRRLATQFLEFWRTTGAQHFREEEEILLPAYARHVRLDQDAPVMRMLAEHAIIRGQVELLEAALAEDRAVEEILGALETTLQQHVRLEEDQIFPALEAALGEEELTALAGRFSRLHNQCDRKE